MALVALGWLWWRAWVSPGVTALCVAGVALGDIDLYVAGVALVALGWLWWRAWVSPGVAALCVAGVALGDIDLHFMWQA